LLRSEHCLHWILDSFFWYSIDIGLDPFAVDQPAFLFARLVGIGAMQVIRARVEAKKLEVKHVERSYQHEDTNNNNNSNSSSSVLSVTQLKYLHKLSEIAGISSERLAYEIVLNPYYRLPVPPVTTTIVTTASG